MWKWLHLQVCTHLQAVAKPCGVWVVPIVGGIAAAKQERLLRRRPQVVVATPGRLWELMREGDAHLTDMSQLSFLVLDEADRMVQQGHFEVIFSPLGELFITRCSLRSLIVSVLGCIWCGGLLHGLKAVDQSVSGAVSLHSTV